MPRLRSASVSDDNLLSAPRSLNEAVKCKFSNLRKISQPAICDSVRLWCAGVGVTALAIVAAAAWMSCNETGRPALATRFMLRLGSGW